VDGPIAQLLLEFEGRREFLTHEGVRSGLTMLGAMLVSFVFIRTSARLMRSPKVPWWPGSVTPGGLHIHHLVFGIVLMLLGGFLLALQVGSPGIEIVAAVFGIGAGLTLDEFALWLHLEDVYWAEEGRRSVDAVVIASVVAGLLLLGFVPVSTDESIPGIVATVLVLLAAAAVAIAKGKVVLGVAGMLFPLLGMIGAIRLAKPGSPWARRRYRDGSRKLARAEARSARHARRYRRFQDVVAGAPTAPLEAARAGAPAAPLEPAPPAAARLDSPPGEN
jgi:lysyl-tRNA synthetase, class II